MYDHTCNDAVKNVAAELLINAMNELEQPQRVLVFARVALETPMTALVQEFELTVEEIEQEIEAGLQILRAADGIEDLAEIHRLGQLVDFHDHIHRLKLQRWFCQMCHKLLIHKKTGRPRTLCSIECSNHKKRLRRALLKQGTA